MIGKLVDIPSVPDPRGDICVIEAVDVAGFEFRRVYYFDGSPDTSRGAHAHKKLRQLIVCPRGRVTVELENAGGRASYCLQGPKKGLLVPAGTWRDLKDFSGDALVVVFASDPYHADDYIRDYDTYKLWLSAEAAGKAVAYLPMGRMADTLKSEFMDAFARVVEGAQYIGGPFVSEFENSFARYCGASHAVGCGNGLDALALILEAYGIGAGDEVIVPANSFIATALAVSRVGASPVFVDCTLAGYGIDVDAVRRCITPRTRAVIPVHLYGLCADMAPLMALAEQYGFKVVEDAAQAHGAEYAGRRAGALGHAAAFSFYPTKNLGALGDAGAVVTNDTELAARVRLLGNYGSVKKYHHETKGWNTRLDPVQAALLSVKMRYLDQWNARRRTLANIYSEMLSGCPGLVLPEPMAGSVPVWHVFPVFVKNGGRNALQAYLKEHSVDTLIHYPVPIHRQKSYAEYSSDSQFPCSENASAGLLSLPLDPYHTEDEIRYVAQTILKFYG